LERDLAVLHEKQFFFVPKKECVYEERQFPNHEYGKNIRLVIFLEAGETK
jgi:hypothetical protein